MVIPNLSLLLLGNPSISTKIAIELSQPPKMQPSDFGMFTRVSVKDPSELILNVSLKLSGRVETKLSVDPKIREYAVLIPKEPS